MRMGLMARWAFLILGASFFGFSAAPSFGKTKPREAQSALYGYLLWGECELAEDPEAHDPWPFICIRPKASTQVFIREDNGAENLLLNYASLYTSIHLLEYVSLHGEWERSRLMLMDAHEGQDAVDDERKPVSAFLQLGNNALHRFRLSVGKLHIPFGVDHQPHMEIFNRTVKSRRYWRTPRWGLRLTFDTQVSSQYEVGIATSKTPGQGSDQDEEIPENRAVSARMMFDIGALEGFRFVISGYGESEGERRLGVGFVTISRRGDGAALEWVRIRETPDGRDQPFDQLFRLSYATAFYSATRWVLEYEDERFGYRLGTIGADFAMPYYALLRLAISYHDTFAEKDDFWIFTSGFQLAL